MVDQRTSAVLFISFLRLLWRGPDRSVTRSVPYRRRWWWLALRHNPLRRWRRAELTDAGQQSRQPCYGCISMMCALKLSIRHLITRTRRWPRACASFNPGYQAKGGERDWPSGGCKPAAESHGQKESAFGPEADMPYPSTSVRLRITGNAPSNPFAPRIVAYC